MLAFHNTDLKQKAVLRFIDPLLVLLGAERLNEFIRVLIRPHINDFRYDSHFLENRDCAQRRFHARTITVIGQIYFLCITLEQIRMSTRQRRTKRCDRIVKACLMQRDHIHISLTQEKLVLPRASCNIQSVKITAFVKNLCLRGV